MGTDRAGTQRRGGRLYGFLLIVSVCLMLLIGSAGKALAFSPDGAAPFADWITEWQGTPTTQPPAPWTHTSTPYGLQGYGGQWIEVAVPGGYLLQAAVFRPNGQGPFPLVVVLHGTEGFSSDILLVAQDFAAQGFMALAGCWSRLPVLALEPDPVLWEGVCSEAPPMRGANLGSAEQALALVEAGRSLPEVRADRVGVFGHSRGAALALLLASTTPWIQAVTASSGQYSNSPLDTSPFLVAEGLEARLLIVHSRQDAVIPVRDALDYEQTVRDLGKSVTSFYYDDGNHATYLVDPQVRTEVLEPSIAFFKQYLED